MAENDRDSVQHPSAEETPTVKPDETLGSREPLRDPTVDAIKLTSVRDARLDRQTEDQAPSNPKEGTASGTGNYHSVLLVGDSLAYGLGISIARDLKQQQGTSFSSFTKVSSGLNNPNVLNWEKTIPMLIEKEPPQLIMIMMGVNDANNHIRDGGKLCVVGTNEWRQAYEKKIENFLGIVARSNARVCWIGAPVVREEWLQERVTLANMAAQNACGRMENCRFIDTADVLCDENGKYTNYLQEPNGSSVRIRAKDGIHFSVPGGDLLSKRVLLNLKNQSSGSSHTNSRPGEARGAVLNDGSR
jgi:hypothetical protein